MGLSLSALSFCNLVLKMDEFPLDLFGLEVQKMRLSETSVKR